MNRTFEDVLVEQCAPTLAGIKPASLFRFQADSLETIRLHTAEWDQPAAFLWDSRASPEGMSRHTRWHDLSLPRKMADTIGG